MAHRDGAMRRCFYAALITAVVLTGANPSFAEGASFPPLDAPQYARFCSGEAAAAKTEAERSRKAQEATDAAAALVTDTAVAQSVQRRLHLPRPPQIVARNAQRMLGKAGDPNTYLLSDLDPATPHWWQATLDPSGSVDAVTIANARAIQTTVGFARGIAAYMLFNDALGGDAPLARSGCGAAFTQQFGTFPAVNAALQRVILQDPVQDASLSAAVREAWNVLGDDRLHKARDLALTRETLRAIGLNPTVTLVYRDPGLPGDGIGNIDVVRIGTSPHTYAIVDDKRPITLDGAPLCIVGDERCATYYSWP